MRTLCSQTSQPRPADVMPPRLQWRAVHGVVKSALETWSPCLLARVRNSECQELEHRLSPHGYGFLNEGLMVAPQVHGPVAMALQGIAKVDVNT